MKSLLQFKTIILYTRLERTYTRDNTNNAVFWDVAPCRSCVNRRFGGTYRLHLQGRKIRERGTSVSRWLQTEPLVENTQLYVYKNSLSLPFLIQLGVFDWWLSLQPPAHAGSSLADFSTLNMKVIRSSETSVHKIYTAPHPRRRHSS
jgi:hypothetical protein